MYTLAALWVIFTFLEGGMAGATDQPWWVYQAPFWGPIIVLGHCVVGYAAYREHAWARWGAAMTLSATLFLLVYMYLCYLRM